MNAIPIILALAALALFAFAYWQARKAQRIRDDYRRRLEADEARVHDYLYGGRWRSTTPPRLPRR